MIKTLAVISILLTATISGYANGPKTHSKYFFYVFGGTIGDERLNARETVGNRWGIKYKALTDPNFVEWFLKHTDRHNEKTSKQLAEKFGVDWEKKFNAEVDLELKTQTAVRALVYEQPYYKDLDSTLRSEARLMCYLAPIIQDSIYSVVLWNEDWVFPKGKQEYVAYSYYKLVVDLFKKEVRIESDQTEPFEVDYWMKTHWYQRPKYARL